MRLHRFSRAGFLCATAAAAVLPACSSYEDTNTAIIRRIIDSAYLEFGVVVNTLGPASEWVFRANADATFPAASLAKLGVAIAALHFYGASPNAMAIKVNVTQADLQASSSHLPRRLQSYPLGDLLTLMLQISDNVAANALISSLGVNRINRYLIDAGAASTKITGLYTDSAFAGERAVTTPRDLSYILNAIVGGARGKRSSIGPAASEILLDILSGQEDRSLIPAGLPCAVQVANKTGELSDFVGDTAIIDPLSDSPIVIVALAKVINLQARETIQRRLDAIRRIRKLSYAVYGMFGTF